MRRRTLYHLSPHANRASILEHGLDPRRMGAAPGVAGSIRRELDGVYVCTDRDGADFFAEMGMRRGVSLDLWAIDDHGSVLQTGTSGFEYLPVPVPPERVRLAEVFGAAGPPELEASPPPGVASLGVGVGVGVGVVAAAPARQPLPPGLADDVAAGLRDLDRDDAVVGGWTFGLGADALGSGQWADSPDDEEEWEDCEEAYQIVDVELYDGDGSLAGGAIALLDAEPALRRVEVATRLQRIFIELEAVAGTLHPPCGDHPHAAVAEVRDGAAWWTCPVDGGPIARIGAHPG